MDTVITLGDLEVEVVLKDIKNMHLSVYPPSGRVRIAAPSDMSLDTVRVYAISKLEWIKAQQRKLRQQQRETERDYTNRESHYLWGKRYLLRVIEVNHAPSVELRHSAILLRVRPGTDKAARRHIMNEWYRCEVRRAASAVIARWEDTMGIRVEHLYVRKMKTKWGSCNPKAGSIRLNTELAKKPREHLEYIVVHEMAHLLEPTHSARFVGLMDRHLPDWRLRRDRLNAAPLGHEEWTY